MAGNPAISVPAGFDNKGMPFGVQVMTDLYREKQMFDFANYLTKEIIK
jgi:aspartyl-tRNA(Asn)/glutamyl-tRNA(Gln) amidotransferase subunit A